MTSTTSWVGGVGTTRTHAVVGSTNRLSAAGYDGAGNQTTWGTYAYTWDSMGLMEAYTGSGNKWAYAYDADDERMLVYNAANGQSVFRIRGLDGKVLREIKFSGSAWSWGKDWIYRDGQLLATVAPGSVIRYAHADHLGSARLFTDASGNAQERFHYYPFGEQAGSAPAAPEALRFTGHERDLGTGTGTADDLDYMHARYYHPQLGRFLSVDPARASAKPEQPQTWNRYTYSYNNPVNAIDPDGQLPVILGAIVGAVEGVGFQVATNVISGDPITQGVVQEALIGGGLGATGVGLANTARKGVQAMQAARVLRAVRSGKASTLAKRAGLSKTAQKGIRSVEKRIDEHRQKLEAFKKSPDQEP